MMLLSRVAESVYNLAVTDLPLYAEDLQVGIAELHLRLGGTYFAAGQSQSPPPIGDLDDEVAATGPRAESHLLNR